MSQKKYWDKEYKEPTFLSLSKEPQYEITRFIKYLKTEAWQEVEGKIVLDLGCGNGRNLHHFSEKYACAGFGWDISPEAIVQAKELALPGENYEARSIGSAFSLEDKSIDIILDITASPSLYQGERQTYLEEAARALKDDGWMLVRLLCKDGDKNARNMMERFPGPEKDSYIHPDTLIVETVFSERDFKALYGQYFDIKETFKTTGYQRWHGQSFKRRYLVAYLQKKT
jgi:SAM-dependent methyltransferase